MAKSKKEKSIEQMLDEALVKENEWPYKVPENWVWAKVSSLFKFIGGGTPSKRNSSYWHGDINWASVKDIKGEYLYSTSNSRWQCNLLIIIEIKLMLS